MQEVPFPVVLSEKKKNGWTDYLRRAFGPPLFVQNRKGGGLTLRMPGKMMSLYVNNLAVDFFNVARGLTTLASQFYLTFDEKFRDLFQAYGVMGADLIRVASIAVNIATRREATDAPVDKAAVQLKNFFRLASDHTKLPSFEEAENDYSLPAYTAGGGSKPLRSRRS